MTTHELQGFTLDQHRQAKLNVFVLPSQTTILCLLVISSIYGILIAVSIGKVPFPIWPLALGLCLLSFRGWLAWPERFQRQYRLAPAKTSCPRLQACIKHLAQELGLKRVPYLMLGPTIDISIYGGWRRWYIAIGEDRGAIFEQALDSPELRPYVEAVILHELHHFKHKDHRLIEYLRVYLHLSWQFVGCAALLILGWTTFAAIFKNDFLKYTPEEHAARVEALFPGYGFGELYKISMPSYETWLYLKQTLPPVNPLWAGLYAFANTWLIVLLSSILVIVLWRKILRLRELYADAGVVHTQGTIEFLLHAGVFLNRSVSLSNSEQSLSVSDGKRSAWLRQLEARVVGFRERLMDYGERWTGWLKTHPPSDLRVRCLLDPALAFDTWKATGYLIGMIALGLDLLLMSTAASFYMSRWPLHVSVLVVFCLGSLFLIPGSILGRDMWRESFYIVNLVVLIRCIAVMVISVVLVIASIALPEYLVLLAETFRSIVTGYNGVAPQPISGDIGVHVARIVRELLVELPVVWVVSIGAIWVQLQVTQRVLTWYGLPQAGARCLRTIYVSMGLLALTLALGVLPLITDLVLLRFADLLLVLRWATLCVTILVLLLVGWWLLRQERTYALRCPACDGQQPGRYVLGKRCSRCGYLFHPWLMANYCTLEEDE